MVPITTDHRYELQLTMDANSKYIRGTTRTCIRSLLSLSHGVYVHILFDHNSFKLPKFYPRDLEDCSYGPLDYLTAT